MSPSMHECKPVLNVWFVIYSEFHINLVICDIYKCGLSYITVDFWFVIYICFVAYIENLKTKKSFQSGFPECMGCDTRGTEFLTRVPGLWLSGKRVSSPSAWTAALGEKGVFPECCTRERFFLKKEMTPAATNGVNSSPSARTTLGEAFPECTIFGSRGRRLSHEEIPRGSSSSVALGEGFPECNWAFPECF